MKIGFLMFLFLSLTVFSCRNKNVDENALNNYHISIDTLVIDITSKELPYYYTIDFYQGSITNEQKLIGYNHFKHSFDIFDLSSKEVSKNILLEYKGPNGVLPNSKFNILNKDSIVLLNNNKYYAIVNSKGKVIFKRDISAIFEKSDYLLSKGLTVSEPSNNIALIGINPVHHIIPKKFDFLDKEFYNIPFLSITDPINDTFTLLNVDYPQEASSQNLFGFLLRPYILINGNEVIYNFPFSSKVFVYNIIAETVRTFNIKSDYTKNISNELKMEMSNSSDVRILGEHFRNTLHFHKIVFDPYKKLFYRVHSTAPELKKNGKKIRDSFLCVFNNEFEKLFELKLNSELYINDYIPTESGIVFQILNNNLNEINQLKLYRLDFQFQ